MNINEQIQRLKKHTYDLMRHRFVEEYILPPAFNEAKVFVAYSLLSELQLDEAVEAEYFSAILMIQSALDRHENILDEEIKSHKKRRQLVVLSGDYFSSLYYSLLANCENIHLISALSKAVKSINECKAQLHDRSSLQTQSIEWLKTVQKVESLLYTKAASSLGLQKYNRFIENFLLLSCFQSTNERRLLTEEQLLFIRSLEAMMTGDHLEKPLLFERDEWSKLYFMENDLMLGEG
jgi:heptaprenyl diphosphate synthase